MSIKDWERKVLDSPGAAERVSEVEDELRLAAGLTALREQASLSQRDMAKRIGVRRDPQSRDGSGTSVTDDGTIDRCQRDR